MADNAAVFEFLGRLLRERRGVFAAMVLFNAVAAATGLLVPRLLGDLIDRTVAGDSSSANVSTLALVIIGVVVAQSLLTFLGQWTSTVFGQDILSSARESIVETILRLPLGRVEGASTGDLVTRVTRDVGTMSRSVQYGVPMAIISLLTVVLSIVAMLLNSVFLAVPALVLIGASMFQVRRYLVRAQKCYITEGATYSRINTTMSETVEGARTVEALGLEELRARACDDDIDVSAQAERYGLTLRNLLFAVIDVAFNAPRVITVLAGAYGYSRGWVSLGEITAAVLYAEGLSGPLDRLVGEVDRLQVGAASTSRLLGIAQVPPDRTPRRPAAVGPRPGRRGPALRLPRGTRRTPRDGPDPAHRRTVGGRRAERFGKVDPGSAAVRHQRPAHWFGAGRRRRPDLASAGGAAHRGRPGHPGAPRVRRIGP